MLVKKNKKSLFSISLSNSFFNKSFFSNILKFLGILQIIFLVSFLYIAIALDKNEIRQQIRKTKDESDIIKYIKSNQLNYI